jgi:RimJ/RimL family protein N-acetyltransferase
VARRPLGSGRFRLGSRSVELPFTSRRLRYRSPRPDDLPELVALHEGDPSIAKGTLRVPHPYRLEDGRRYLRRVAEGFRTGRSLGLFLERRRDGALIGGAGLHDLSVDSTVAGLGYWIGRPYRGRGYATEAADRLARLALGPLGRHRVEADVFPFNRASMAVLRRAGFVREGIAREVHRKDGRWLDEVRFARLAPARSGRRTA